MIRRATAALLLVVTLSGCATLGKVQYALEQFPQRTEDAFSDPTRRLHLFQQLDLVVETALVGIVCTLLVPIPIIGGIGCPLVALGYNYLIYEYVAEPVARGRVEQGLPSNTGPYWERGPRDGEVFVNP